MMKQFFYILLGASLLLSYPLQAQTPYDSFSPETWRPILDLGVFEHDDETHSEPDNQVPYDTILCAAVIDRQEQVLLLVDIESLSVLAFAPLNDDLHKWISPDPLLDKFINSTPYNYCLNNPISNVDQHGDSSAIFIAKHGAVGYGHMAVAVQDNEGNWYLYSKNGAGKCSGLFDSSPSSPPNDEGHKIASPEVFLNDQTDNTMCHDGKGGQYYTGYYVLPTTPEQDQIIAGEMTNQIENIPYNLFTNNCTQAVQRALQKAGVPIGIETMIPNDSMEAIQQANPYRHSVLQMIRLYRTSQK